MQCGEPLPLDVNPWDPDFLVILPQAAMTVSECGKEALEEGEEEGEEQEGGGGEGEGEGEGEGAQAKAAAQVSVMVSSQIFTSKYS